MLLLNGLKDVREATRLGPATQGVGTACLLNERRCRKDVLPVRRCKDGAAIAIANVQWVGGVGMTMEMRQH
ncbi:GL21037 [Drosophila persimilis]|uniref:GL21037 n=1 Tax=Drosophila persimilis TaxID=7234 RepID=B4IR51_DROPE|nr:GL21037 [Drosophila persimilis]